MIRDLVAIFGVIAGFSYYVLTVRNSQKNQQMQLETRQAQLFMQVYTQWRDPDRLRLLGRSRALDHNPEAYAKRIHIITELEGLGHLLSKGLLDLDLIPPIIKAVVKLQWEKWGPIELEYRRRQNPERSKYFEYIYNEIKRREHPELKT